MVLGLTFLQYNKDSLAKIVAENLELVKVISGISNMKNGVSLHQSSNSEKRIVNMKLSVVF